MREAKELLWRRIEGYNFEHIVQPSFLGSVAELFGGADAATKAFAEKIARKKDWTTEFALRAVDEYKKFLYLGVAGDVVVTPSLVIDQVWHQHLQFTKAYREFCEDVLCADFDHFPELVATNNQTDIFQAQYAATLAMYQREFRTNPPKDIWGEPKFTKVGSMPTVEPKRKSRDTGNTPYDDTPLYMYIDGGSGHQHAVEPCGEAHHASEGFGGGDTGGGGASGDSGGGDSGGGGGGCSSGCGGGGD